MPASAAALPDQRRRAPSTLVPQWSGSSSRRRSRSRCSPPRTARARTIVWSGQSWDVRPAGTGEPGPNAWSDSEANVHVDGADLVLSVVQGAGGAWTSAEVDGRRSLGYGTYRWVVASDLSGLDANEVLGMFTYGGDDPSNNELDLEASHWGNLAWASGSGTVWQDASAGLRRSRTFAYTARPPVRPPVHLGAGAGALSRERRRGGHAARLDAHRGRPQTLDRGADDQLLALPQRRPGRPAQHPHLELRLDPAGRGGSAAASAGSPATARPPGGASPDAPSPRGRRCAGAPPPEPGCGSRCGAPPAAAASSPSGPGNGRCVPAPGGSGSRA